MTDLPLLLFVGAATEDSIALVERYPGRDERVVAQSIELSGGGPAATAAVAAARLGMRTAIVAAVGEDAAGGRVRGALRTEGVDVSGLRTVPGATTSRSVVVISGSEHSRAIVNQPGPVIEWTSEDNDRLTGAAWVHVDQHGWAPLRTATTRLGRTTQLSLDAGNPIEDLDVAAATLYVPTLPALLERYGRDGTTEVATLLGRALDDGAGRAVVTDGARGCYGMGADRQLLHVPAPAEPVRSTLGAGDVFHGALLAGLVHAAHGEIASHFQAAIAYATTAATVSCRATDGRSGIPEHAEVLSRLDPIHTNEG
ncbi:PfkB family carbohydrate kinase [Ruania albidiflava]|uniref:PfkB family carbohydrate kinase n=1 Tax=Ruania albidiflava TaxID=366586 RepID=UPI0003B59D1E|nr:PfkB family carbohydrate kinase [Ruania albidiflava]